MNMTRKNAIADLKCGGCGGCCRQPVVALTHFDVERLLQATGKEILDLVKLYGKQDVEYEKDDDDWVKLKNGKAMLGLRKPKKRCIFLSDDNRCLQYEHRPMSCRIYPMMLVFGDDPNDGFELDDFNAAGVASCTARTVRAKDPKQVKKLFRQMRREREAYWKLLRKWEKRKKQGGKRKFLRYLGFDVPKKKSGK